MGYDKRYVDLDDGRVQLFKWTPLETPKAIVIIVHGMGEHAERYDYFANQLVKDNYLVICYNQKGHKGSIYKDSEYGYMGKGDNFKILVRDLNKIIDITKIKHPKMKIFIFGHSMGSFVTQYYLQEYQTKIQGVILSGSARLPNSQLYPGFILASIINFFFSRNHRSKLINSLTFGKYNKQFKPNRTMCDWLSRDDDEVDNYIEDKYCGGIFSTAYFKDFFKALIKINTKIKSIDPSLPILLMSGEHDQVGGNGKYVKALFKKLDNSNVRNVDYKIYVNARHEILKEINKEEVIEDSINWFNYHL